MEPAEETREEEAKAEEIQQRCAPGLAGGEPEGAGGAQQIRGCRGFQQDAGAGQVGRGRLHQDGQNSGQGRENRS